MYVCQTITFESPDVGSSSLHIRYISMAIRVMYKGDRVKVKVTGTKKFENMYSCKLGFSKT